MKSIIQNAKVIERNITIIDYSVEHAIPVSPPPYAKSSRGWFKPHEGLRYLIETERKRECLRFEVRK
jgi:hypothetical protein